MTIKKRLMLGCFVLMLLSCDSREDDLVQYIQLIKNEKVNIQDTIPLFKPLEFSYPESHRSRNPFIPKPAESSESVAKNSSKQLLDRFILNSLKFVGLLQSSTMNWALIQGPDGKITHVKTGDYIGKDNVELIKIKNDALLFEQQIFTEGKWQQKIVKIPLSHRKRG